MEAAPVLRTELPHRPVVGGGGHGGDEEIGEAAAKQGDEARLFIKRRIKRNDCNEMQEMGKREGKPGIAPVAPQPACRIRGEERRERAGGEDDDEDEEGEARRVARDVLEDGLRRLEGGEASERDSGDHGEDAEERPAGISAGDCHRNATELSQTGFAIPRPSLDCVFVARPKFSYRMYESVAQTEKTYK